MKFTRINYLAATVVAFFSADELYIDGNVGAVEDVVVVEEVEDKDDYVCNGLFNWVNEFVLCDCKEPFDLSELLFDSIPKLVRLLHLAEYRFL